MPDIELKQLSLDMGKLEYDMLQRISAVENGTILFKELLKKCKEIGYKEIKLFPMKSNEPTIKIMLKKRRPDYWRFQGSETYHPHTN